MITEERLKELIEKGATIYYVDKADNMRGKIDLSEYEVKIVDNYFLIKTRIKPDFSNYFGYETDWHYDFRIYLSYTFETEEDAEFVLRYKRIPKTEYLDLPTWEEFNKDNFGIRFYNKSREFRLHRVRYSASDKNPLWKIDLYESYGDDEDTVAWEKSWDLTKENYLEACELCRKLWLGERV